MGTVRLINPSPLRQRPQDDIASPSLTLYQTIGQSHRNIAGARKSQAFHETGDFAKRKRPLPHVRANLVLLFLCNDVPKNLHCVLTTLMVCVRLAESDMALLSY